MNNNVRLNTTGGYRGVKWRNNVGPELMNEVGSVHIGGGMIDQLRKSSRNVVTAAGTEARD